ncbi:Rid family hydrolase [Escherichia coli]
MKKIIETQRAPGAIGPYVQGVDLGSMVFTSGQIPVCPQTGDIIKMTVFITDLNDFATINEVYKQFFDEHQATYPTRSCVQVARLPKDVKLEIEAIAVRSA